MKAVMALTVLLSASAQASTYDELRLHGRPGIVIEKTVAGISHVAFIPSRDLTEAELRAAERQEHTVHEIELATTPNTTSEEFAMQFALESLIGTKGPK